MENSRSFHFMILITQSLLKYAVIILPHYSEKVNSFFEILFIISDNIVKSFPLYCNAGLAVLYKNHCWLAEPVVI